LFATAAFTNQTTIVTPFVPLAMSPVTVAGTVAQTLRASKIPDAQAAYESANTLRPRISAA
jgi:trimethylamine:corrinoid methyltransferase-like protein